MRTRAVIVVAASAIVAAIGALWLPARPTTRWIPAGGAEESVVQRLQDVRFVWVGDVARGYVEPETWQPPGEASDEDSTALDAGVGLVGFQSVEGVELDGLALGLEALLLLLLSGGLLSWAVRADRRSTAAA